MVSILISCPLFDQLDWNETDDSSATRDYMAVPNFTCNV